MRLFVPVVFTLLLAPFAGLAEDTKPRKDGAKQTTQAPPKRKPRPQPKPVTEEDLQDAAKKAKKNPDDAAALNKFYSAGLRMFFQVYLKDLDAAEKLVKQLQSDWKAVKATKENTKKIASRATTRLEYYAERIETDKERNKLVGKPAFPLKALAWANGKPLTNSDLKGKVVLLDFWAVWCGPCIRTFPNLRKWQDKWGEKGLVIIGVTRYYNRTWDDEAKKAKRPADDEKVSPEDERNMLAEFAEHYKLKHRFLISPKQEEGEDAPKVETLQKDYMVRGIPQVVVIDREGIIRLIRVGASESSEKAIEGMLEKLLEAKSAAGGGE